jgi:hypothetical protein
VCRNALFKLQSRYIVDRMDNELWAKALDEQNKFRRQLIDQVSVRAMTSLYPSNRHDLKIEIDLVWFGGNQGMADVSCAEKDPCICLL